MGVTTLIPELYKVVDYGDGFLAVMPRPRANDWLVDEIRGLQALGVGAIASLLEPDEVAELGLQEEAAIAEQRGLTFLSYPIPDRRTPTQLSEFGSFVRSLASHVRSGKGLAIHCRAGIGRSGITAAATLVALGHEHSSAFELISSARGLRVPDTEVQIQWFQENWREFQGDA